MISPTLKSTISNKTQCYATLDVQITISNGSILYMQNVTPPGHNMPSGSTGLLWFSIVLLWKCIKSVSTCSREVGKHFIRKPVLACVSLFFIVMLGQVSVANVKLVPGCQ